MKTEVWLDRNQVSEETASIESFHADYHGRLSRVHLRQSKYVVSKRIMETLKDVSSTSVTAGSEMRRQPPDVLSPTSLPPP